MKAPLLPQITLSMFLPPSNWPQAAVGLVNLSGADTSHGTKQLRDFVGSPGPCQQHARSMCFITQDNVPQSVHSSPRLPLLKQIHSSCICLLEGKEMARELCKHPTDCGDCLSSPQGHSSGWNSPTEAIPLAKVELFLMSGVQSSWHLKRERKQ